MQPDPGNHTFLSYRSFEDDFALKLAADLKKAGLKLWMDRLDGIRVGMDWRQCIENAVRDCAAMICVMSPDYITSEYCRKELGRANTLNRAIYPIMLHIVEVANIPIELEGVQWEDFTAWRDETEYSRHFTNLLRRLKEEKPEIVGIQPDAENSYLLTLLADLEARRGVLNYVQIRAQTEGDDQRPEPVDDDEWGFSELLTPPKSKIPTSTARFDSISDATLKHLRFILIGDPGAGKTTILRRLARGAVLKRLESPRLEPLPIVLNLSEWEVTVPPIEFVRAKYPFEQDLASLLKNGQVVLFLDGLNEMGDRTVENAKALGRWIKSSDGPQRIIITCRSADYALRDMQLPGLPTILAHPLQETQIRQFSTNYLGDCSDSFLQRVLQEKKEPAKIQYEYKKFQETRELASLASNPYMLSAMIFLYEKSSDKELPNKTGILFQKLLRALWAREGKRGTAGSISYEEAEARFAKLAFRMIRDGPAMDTTAMQAIESLGHPQLLYAGAAANYVIVSGDNVRFYHQLIQEYFAAVELREMALDEIAEPLELNKGPNYVWLKHSYESRWYQPITMLFEIADNLAEQLRQVSKINPFFAVELMDEVDSLPADWGQTTARRILLESDRLMSELKRLDELVAEKKTDSGRWDDIEESIGDSEGEIQRDTTLALSRLGVSKNEVDM